MHGNIHETMQQTCQWQDKQTQSLQYKSLKFNSISASNNLLEASLTFPCSHPMSHRHVVCQCIQHYDRISIQQNCMHVYII